MSERAEKGKQASVDGFAHEHIAMGILMKRYQNVSLVDLPHSPYDIIIVRKNEEKNEDIIRAQVRTAKESVDFTGGGRGGVERKQISNIKQYVQSTKLSDVIIGISAEDKQRYDLYIVPTILVELLKHKGKQQKSISKKKAASLRNNYELLDRCKDREFVIAKAREYGLLKD